MIWYCNTFLAIFVEQSYNELGKPQKKVIFLSGPATKALPPPITLLVAGPRKKMFAASLVCDGNDRNALY